MNASHLLPASILIGMAIGVQASQVPTPFANGKAEVVVPAGYVVSVQPNGTLVATFGPRNDHKLELTLHDHDGTPGAPHLAEQFVRAQAKKKNRSALSGAGKVILMEPGPEFREGAITFRTFHWQVGFGKSLVVVTLTAPVEEPISSTLKEFLDTHLNTVIHSLRRRAV